MHTITKYILSMPSPLIEEIITSSGFKLYLEGQYGEGVNFNATSNATVEYVPYGVKSVKPGDDVAISYRVMANKIFPNNATQFYPFKVSEQYQEYLTAKGYRLRKLCMPSTTGAKVWIGILQDRTGDLIDGAQGDESTVDRWFSQFPLGNKDKFTYRNLINLGDKVYWKADKIDIFAKKVGDKIVSVSDRIICKPFSIDWTERYNIINKVRLAGALKEEYDDRAVVVCSAGYPHIKEGDIIGFPPLVCEKYTLWGEQYFLIGKKFVSCIWENT